MYPRELKEKATVTGKDFWGRPAQITFEPYDAPGWYWKHHPDEEPVQISAHLLQRRPRQVVLAHEGAVLEAFEHIAPLRWMGLVDGVCIFSSAHPPFFGRTFEFWRAIMPKCSISYSRKVPWCTVSDSVRATLTKRSRYTEIKCLDEGYCRLSLSCSYKGLGDKELQVESLDEGIIQAAFFAYTQGWPPPLYYPSSVAALFGWPHHKHILWPQKCPSNDHTLILFLQHRLLDVLGAMAFVHPVALLSAHITSVASGHEADITAIKQAQPFLRLL